MIEIVNWDSSNILSKFDHYYLLLVSEISNFMAKSKLILVFEKI